jgi:CDP-6-deoxy-D-xylo-4-hexulose-3-dehydrase
MGAITREFERRFAAHHNRKHAVMVNSGSSANLLMVAALHYTGRLPRGSRVAVPALSWNTTYSPLQQFDMQQILVDINGTLNIDPMEIPVEVDLIFGVNILGNCMEYDALPRGIPLIEDNCESLGATNRGRISGSVGLMASFSFFFSHHMVTMEGGMIVTNDDELADYLRMLRAHGWARDLDSYQRDRWDAAYEFFVPGFSVRPTELQAALGVVQLEKLGENLKARRRNGAAYKALLGCQREVGNSSWFGFPVIVRDRQKVINRISPVFDSRPVVAGNIARHPAARFYKFETGPHGTPVADFVHEHGFYIGNHARDCIPAIEHLADMIRPELFAGSSWIPHAIKTAA